MTSNISFAPAFDYATATTAAALALAAYQKSPLVLGTTLRSDGWTPFSAPSGSYVNFDEGGGFTAKPQVFNIENEYAFAAQRSFGGKTQFAMSFRGTDSAKDWVDNLGARGFSDYYVAVRPVLEEVLWNAWQAMHRGERVEVLLTGHSLGGAAVQAALLDILVEYAANVWTEPTKEPLDAGDRLGQSEAAVRRFWTELNTPFDWKAALQELRPMIRAYTFGAPSISADSLHDLGPALSAAGLDVLRNQLFQFEHEDFDIDLSGGDPVSSIGFTEYGQVIDLDLSDGLRQRYDELDFGLFTPEVHGMGRYQETVLRVLDANRGVASGSMAVEPGTAELPDGARLVGGGGSENNLLRGTGLLSGGGGNDVLVAQLPGTTQLAGGSGANAYVVDGDGLDVSIRGSASSRQDTLFLFGEGNIRVDDVGDEGDSLVLTFGSPAGVTSRIEIGDWFGPSRYALADIVQVHPNAAGWYTTAGRLQHLHVPLANTSTPGDDTIFGSAGDDQMAGGAGSDRMRGRAGNDSLRGELGADTLLGGSDDDTLSGGANDDSLDGEAGADRLDGGAGSDTLVGDALDVLAGGTGNDLYRLSGTGNWRISDESGAADTIDVDAPGVDPLRTRFVVADDGGLRAELRSAAGVAATVWVAVSDGLVTLETLRVGPGRTPFDLQDQLGQARAGISLAPPVAGDTISSDTATNGRIAVGASVISAIDVPGDRDWFRTELVAGHSYRVQVKPAGTSGGLAAPYITLRDAATKVLKYDEGDATGAAEFTHTATVSATYYVGVGGADTAATGGYALTVTDLANRSANTAPSIVGAAKAIPAGVSVAASTLFLGNDAERQPIASYTVLDDAGGGRFYLDGAPQPELALFTVSATQHAVLTYLPGAAGTVSSFSVRASDGALEGSAETILVTALGTTPAPAGLPQAQPDAVSVAAGSEFVLRPLANDDARLVTITELQGHDPAWITRSAAGDAIVIAPNEAISGTYAFTYSASDGQGSSASAMVTVAVHPRVGDNRVPTVEQTQLTTPADREVAFAPLLSAYDPDPPDTALLRAHSYSTPVHGTVFDRNGEMFYRPDAGFVGSDAFSYIVEDPQGAQVSASVQVTVIQALTARDDLVAVQPGVPVRFDVLQNDTFSVDALFFIQGPAFLGEETAHGSIALDADGQATYTPQAGFTGADSFSYRLLYLGTGAYSTASVILQVGPAPALATSGPDTLVGADTGDAVFAGEGDDVLFGGGGDDILDGGPGFDTVSFLGAPAGITADLREPYRDDTGAINWNEPTFWTHDGLGGRDSLRNLEAVLGSEFADSIRGNELANRIELFGGNDIVLSGTGDDTVSGGDGDDTITTGVGLGTGGAYHFDGGAGNDWVTGDWQADVLDGGAGNDSLDGWGGADSLAGGDGNDRLRGGGRLDGGSGDDQLFVDGSLYGTQANWLSGGTGNDTLQGAGGDDNLLAGDGDDVLMGRGGSNLLDGGAGWDAVSFMPEQQGVLVDLVSGFARTAGGLNTLVGIEAVTGSDNGADVILGSGAGERIDGQYGDDTLQGGGGADTLLGAWGNDLLDGGAGDDTLTGGAGVDTFVLRIGGNDEIADFAPGGSGDVLDLARVFALVGYGGSTPAADGFLRLRSVDDAVLVDAPAAAADAGRVFQTVGRLPGVAAAALVDANFATPLDLAALLAAMPATVTVTAADAVQGPVPGSIGLLEGDDGITRHLLEFHRDGDLSRPLALSLHFAFGAGVDAADFGGVLPQDGAIAFAAGERVRSLPLDVAGDTAYERPERLFVTLAGAGLAEQVQQVLWILSEETSVAGNGVLLGTRGRDFISAGAGADTVLADDDDDQVVLDDGDDLADGGAGDDALQGGAGADTLDGAEGSDTLAAGDGRDQLRAGRGSDVLDGGAGFDELVLSAAPAAVVLDLSSGRGSVGADALTVHGIENLAGSAYADVLAGDAGPNVIDGGTGADTLAGGGGFDLFVLQAGEGEKTLRDFGYGDRILIPATLAAGRAVAGAPDSLAAGSVVLAQGETGSVLYVQGQGSTVPDFVLHLEGSHRAADLQVVPLADGRSLITEDAPQAPLTGLAFHWKSHALLAGVTLDAVNAAAAVADAGSGGIDVRGTRFSAADAAWVSELWADAAAAAAGLSFTVDAQPGSALEFASALGEAWNVGVSAENPGHLRVEAALRQPADAPASGDLRIGTIRILPGAESAGAAGSVAIDAVVLGGIPRGPTGLVVDAPGSSEAGAFATTLSQGRYRLGASAPAPADEAVTSADALAALRLAVGLNPNPDPDGHGPLPALLPSPYQFLAADVTGDGRVTSADALGILRTAVKLANAPRPEWLFVAHDAPLWDTAAGMSRLTRADARWDLHWEAAAGQDAASVVGVVRGDVNGSWSSGSATDLDASDPAYLPALAARLGVPTDVWGFAG